MLFQKNSFHKKNQGKYIIGYELGKEHVQLSYLKVGEQEAKTFSMTAGMEQYNIPFVLYRKEEQNLWYIGREAVKYQEELGGPLLKNLVAMAYRGESVEVYLESYDPCDLLALFVKRSLSYLSLEVPLEMIAGIMFTVQRLDEQMVSVLRRMTDSLQLNGIMLQFMSKEESFYYYNLHSEPTLWEGQVWLYELKGAGLSSYCLSLNRKTRPIVTLVEGKEYPPFSGSEEKEAWDRQFLSYLQEDMAEQRVSAVYLIGEGFMGEWYRQSVRFLCNNRRVFQGNNLYSKGACYGFQDKMEPNEFTTSYVYLGTDKMMANVGMEVISRGAPSYLAVLDGGQSWYECRKEWDMILDGEPRLSFKIIPLDGKNITYEEVWLNGLKKAPLCRIHALVYMESRNLMKVKIQELGFGEFFASGRQSWEETIEL